MVGRGISLKEVADFLGHRSLDTTTIYAKVDLVALREVDRRLVFGSFAPAASPLGSYHTA